MKPCFASVAIALIGAWANATPLARPNFILVLGEGHGWSSTSIQMDDAVPASKSNIARTPNLETLAKSGMRFADFYAASPRCTPSRAAIFTGKSPAQLKMTFVGEGKKDEASETKGKLLPPPSTTELPESETTIAEWLKQAGYATAHFGKWHVGRTDPSRHGFDESDGPTNNGGPDNIGNPHPKQLYGMTERGIGFMERQVAAGKPFYLQLSHYASRRGSDASPEAIAAVKSWGLDLDKQQLGEAASDLDLDIALGQLMAKLDELDIAANTYVLFTTDHGTPGKNPPLTGGKGTVSEGGLRVPFIIRGPAIAAGTCSQIRARHEDLFPTIAALAQIKAPLPEGIEGGNLVPVLIHGGSGTVQRARDGFVVYFPHYDKDPRGPAAAILLDNYKLIRIYETGKDELYDLSNDPGERNNLAERHPERTTELGSKLDDYLKAIGQKLPTPNPGYDPTRRTVGKSPGKKKVLKP